MGTELTLEYNHIPSPCSNLESYIRYVNTINTLSVDEEYELANRLRNYNDVTAAKKLVLSHLRFVVFIAKGYSGYGLPQSDLIQEGNVGLMKAVKKFDPTVGVRLASFAVHWIKSEIHNFVIRNWRIVRIATTKAQRKLFFNLRKMKKELRQFTDLEINDIAKKLNVSVQDVVEMESRFGNPDKSIDFQIEHDDKPNKYDQYLEDVDSNPAEIIGNAMFDDVTLGRLRTAMFNLDDRSKDILQRRWLDDDKATLSDLSKKYNVSIERIRQLEQAAFNKLKREILSDDIIL